MTPGNNLRFLSLAGILAVSGCDPDIAVRVPCGYKAVIEYQGDTLVVDYRPQAPGDVAGKKRREYMHQRPNEDMHTDGAGVIVQECLAAPSKPGGTP